MTIPTNETVVRPTARVLEARRELAHTRVSRPVAWLLVALTGVAVLAPPLIQVGLDLAAGSGPLPALGSPRRLWIDFLQSNGDAVEARLEEESWLRRRLLPPTQGLLTGVLGLGNERVITGDRGWLYLADDFRHVTGRGFLEPRRMARRFVDEGAAADPVPKLSALAAGLARRGVDLIVLPVPAKPTVVPGPLAGRRPAPPVHNASFGLLARRLAARGVEVFDPTPELLALDAAGEASYLRTDTHWSPAGVDRVARALAARLRELGVTADAEALFRRRLTVSADGDLTRMLRLPPGAAGAATETVEVELVLTSAGDPWKPGSPSRRPAGDAAAEVLLLGDSFSNVFSDPALGWGAGAGLAEQLAYHLGAGVDRIALNDGGAEAAVAALLALEASPGGVLGGTRVVIHEFAARELSFADWDPAPTAGGGL